MANLGYVSTFNVNGNELSLKDAALTEIVNEIIEAIGANNTNIAERINDLHNRSFDNTIKISSQNDSEIASIQDGLYKIQYVTVTGEGDNATETLNNSAILIQESTNQYLYKDGQLLSRTKENNIWGNWEANNGSGFETIECGSDFNHVPGTFRDKSRGYYLLHWYSYDSENDWTNENLLLVYYNGSDWIYVPSIDTNSYYNVLFYYDENENYFKNYTESDEYKTIKIGNDDVSEQLQSKLAMTYQDFTDWLTQIGLIIQKEETDSETGNLITKIGTLAENLIYRLDWAVLSYINNNYDENENDPNDQINGINGGLDSRIRNLDYLKWTPETTLGGMGGGITSVGKKAIFGIYFVLNEENNENIDYTKKLIDPVFGDSYIDSYGVYPNQIKDICLLEIETTSSYTNFMHLTAYRCTGTEYLLFGNKKREISFNWDNTEEFHALNFRNVEWTDYNYFLKNINYPVTSVNGMTGAININVGVTSFNGSTGAVTYTAPVTSVNGATGAVTVKANVQSDWNATTGDAVILNKPNLTTYENKVTSVNGQTGAVTITETQLSKGTATGTGNAVTDINVSNHQITLVKGAIYTTQEDVNQSIAALVDSAPETLNTLNELAEALGNDENFATTVATQIGEKYTKPSTGIPASDLEAGVIPTVPVQSVNGQTGAVNINVGVTSFNGSTGAVTYTAPVTSVNGQTGAVTVKANVQSDWNATTGDAVILNKPDLTTYANKVTSVNGQTGAVTINVGVTSFNGSTGAVTYTAPVTSVNGQTGAVTVKANVQSDWNATTGDAVILNKPTIPTVNDSTVTITMNGNTVGTFTLNKSGNTTIDLGTVLTSHQSIKTINNQTITGTGNVDISGLPTVTSADNGKVLMVVNGAWQLVSPVSLYSGSDAPSNSQGNNGDLYVQS